MKRGGYIVYNIFENETKSIIAFNSVSENDKVVLVNVLN